MGHGDELAYLFDAQDLEGNPLPEGVATEDDLKVRNTFTKLIADFARHGTITVGDASLPTFNGGDNNFVQIKPNPVLASNFKYCEVALWTKIGERLKSRYCQFLKPLEVDAAASGQKVVLPHSQLISNRSVLAGIGSNRAKVRNNLVHLG